MDEATMKEVCATLIQNGCKRVHIGGGEPFLDYEGLLTLLKTCVDYGILVDYIETNASWVVSEKDTTQRLRQIKKLGVKALCISVDPYHAEYIPYGRPLSLANVCTEENFVYFIWQERFLRMLQSIDAETAHSRQELEQNLSPSYIYDTANAYGLKIGGRAINIEEEYHSRKPIGDILTAAGDSPCNDLLATNHFHVDMHGNFIPSGCTGIIIPLKELTTNLDTSRYPAFEALLNGGINALHKLAISHKFIPNPDGYTSKCALCFHIRHHLSGISNAFPELDSEHYEHSLRDY